MIRPTITRRQFLRAGAAAAGAAASGTRAAAWAAGEAAAAGLDALPAGPAPAALDLPHFPSRLHAFVWRNWALVPVDRLAAVLGTTRERVGSVAEAMGLRADPPEISADQQRRSYITVIKRNWHLLPYEQLLALLGWTAEELAFVLREDDFLFIKLGSLKPACPRLRYVAPDAATRAREAEFARTVRAFFSGDVARPANPLFAFVRDLSRPATASRPVSGSAQLRYCYSYFALYGDPLLDPAADPYPDGLLARLADAGVNGVWLQAVLHKLAPCPWQPGRSRGHPTRLRNLRALVARAARRGVRVFLYLNEPRAMPLRFFQAHPDLKGVVEGDHATLCTSQPAVREFLTGSVAAICRAVPDLGGFFTITASENLTNCWSHGGGASCPRCASRGPAGVIAGVIAAFHEGLRSAGGRQELIAWDWGWADAWAPAVIEALPAGVALQSVSEWSLPIERGGVKNTVGEYSISCVGPGPRARRHWELARRRGLRVLAKIQAGNTWELAAVPYIPAVALVAEHARNLREAGVDGLMLGWTLGGYPSPNLEAVGAVLAGGDLATVARRRFGPELGPAVMRAWEQCSQAFREFPYDGAVVYYAPFQTGPANLLWGQPTRYAATMVGFGYDDLDRWRSPYPAAVFIGQLEKVAAGFAAAGMGIERRLDGRRDAGAPAVAAARAEARLMTAASLHWQSVANQARFIELRRRLLAESAPGTGGPLVNELGRVLRAEQAAARALFELQSRDARLGFEASNHYFYVPMDLVEKVVNCEHLLRHWLPVVPAGGTGTDRAPAAARAP